MTDLTVAKAGEHADVLRVIGLGSHDSSHVYFVAKGVLATNTREYTNSEGKTVVEGAQAGRENLYLWNGSRDDVHRRRRRMTAGSASSGLAGRRVVRVRLAKEPDRLRQSLRCANRRI